MEFHGDIYVTVENGTEKSNHVFKNENLEFSRGRELFIQNKSSQESDFYETLKMWNEIDKNTNTTSYLNIRTEPISQVESSRKYFVERINEEKLSITFKAF